MKAGSATSNAPKAAAAVPTMNMIPINRVLQSAGETSAILDTSSGCKGPPAPAPAVKLPKKIATNITGNELVNAIPRLATAAKNMMVANKWRLPNRLPIIATNSARKNVPATSMLRTTPIRIKLNPNALR